ncbi:hypothetical protein ACIRD2_08610 [Streptomyces sp. NPDC093595]|uniref:hypothetical protein n=1 Tax=Streptomyces sp. NPDC093595 TaxID=3366045 RepID=UPI00382F42F2
MSDSTGTGGAEDKATARERRDTAGKAALITAIVAVVALVGTGIMTFFDVQLAQDQLEQSRQEQREEARQQAAAVGFWDDNKGVAVISNASTRPLYAVSAEFAMGPASGPSGKGRATWSLYFDVLPPCSRATVGKDLARTFKPGLLEGTLRAEGLRADATLVPVRVRFADAQDTYWVRDHQGLHPAAKDAMRILNLSDDVHGPSVVLWGHQGGELREEERCTPA